jgi:hypothetical protein
VAGGVPGGVGAVDPGEPGHRSGAWPGAGGRRRRTGGPRARRGKGARGRPLPPGLLPGEPARAAGGRPGGPLRQLAARAGVRLQGGAGADHPRAARLAQRSGALPRDASAGAGRDPQEVRHPVCLPGVRDLRPAPRVQQPARQQGVWLRALDLGDRRLLGAPGHRREMGPGGGDSAVARHVGPEPPPGDARSLPPRPPQPGQEPAVDPRRPLDPARPGGANPVPRPAPAGARGRAARHGPAATRSSSGCGASRSPSPTSWTATSSGSSPGSSA